MFQTGCELFTSPRSHRTCHVTGSDVTVQPTRMVTRWSSPPKSWRRTERWRSARFCWGLTVGFLMSLYFCWGKMFFRNVPNSLPSHFNYRWWCSNMLCSFFAWDDWTHWLFFLFVSWNQSNQWCRFSSRDTVMFGHSSWWHRAGASVAGGLGGSAEQGFCPEAPFCARRRVLVWRTSWEDLQNITDDRCNSRNMVHGDVTHPY